MGCFSSKKSEASTINSEPVTSTTTSVDNVSDLADATSNTNSKTNTNTNTTASAVAAHHKNAGSISSVQSVPSATSVTSATSNTVASDANATQPLQTTSSENYQNTQKTKSLHSNVSNISKTIQEDEELEDPIIVRTKSQEERHRYDQQLEFLDQVYRERRVSQMARKSAKLAKLNSDRSERIDAQWAHKAIKEHVTARELFLRMCEKHPYDAFKWEQHIKSFFLEEDDYVAEFGVHAVHAVHAANLSKASIAADEEEEHEWDQNIWMPSDGNVKEVLDEIGFFACLKELLLYVPSRDELHKNLEEAGVHEHDVKIMEQEIEKQRRKLWMFFIYSDEDLLTKREEHEIRTYMTYDEFVSGLSGLISATVDWRGREHKQISDTLFVIMDHDHDGYLDSLDIKTLLLSLHQMYMAVFNYESENEVNREDVLEQAVALLGMDWGPSKEDQPVQFLNKRQFAHLFGELGEKHLKDLDLESILGLDPSSPRSLRA